MANRTVTRTHAASIRNQRQVCDDLDLLGFAASKLWNIARWTAGRIWSETGHIPGHAELSSYLKAHERYADLNAQSSSVKNAKRFWDAKNLRFLSTASYPRTR